MADGKKTITGAAEEFEASLSLLGPWDRRTVPLQGKSVMLQKYVTDKPTVGTP
jgi:hypothetical protein